MASEVANPYPLKQCVLFVVDSVVENPLNRRPLRVGSHRCDKRILKVVAVYSPFIAPEARQNVDSDAESRRRTMACFSMKVTDAVIEIKAYPQRTLPMARLLPCSVTLRLTREGRVEQFRIIRDAERNETREDFSVVDFG